VRSETHEFHSGRERWTQHQPFDAAAKLVITSGAIRVWTIRDGDLQMPPRDFYAHRPAQALCDLEAGKPFCVAALMPNTSFVLIV
jgi:hypothetical protein